MYAKQVNKDASHARELTEIGSQVSDSDIHAMQEINESNTKIGDIIGVIDEIALQTHILALNAAVAADCQLGDFRRLPIYYEILTQSAENRVRIALVKLHICKMSLIFNQTAS